MVKFLFSILVVGVCAVYSQPSACAQAAPIQNTPLIQALLDNKTDRALALLTAGASARDHDQTEGNGHRSALAIALGRRTKTSDKERLVTALLDHGADVNARDDEGTPLFQVGDANPTEAKIVRLLLEYGADPAARDRSGEPLLLHFAQVKDNATVATAIEAMLLEKGVGVDTTDSSGMTALDVAACGSAKRMIAFLLDHGADVNHIDNSKKTPLLWACSRFRFGDAATLRLLLEHGANPGAKDSIGQSALALTIVWRGGADSMVRLLLDHGVEIDARDELGQTALMRAANFTQTATARLLLERGADVNAADNRGRTPLMHAVLGYILIDLTDYLVAIKAKPEASILPTVKLLLQHKASINQRSSRGYTVLSLAQGDSQLSYPRVKELLQQSGAKVFPVFPDSDPRPAKPLPGPTP